MLTVDQLRNFSIFADLEDTDLKYILTLVTVKQFKKDSVVVIEEDEANSVFFIIKGKVKISRLSEDGREVILTILGDFDFFGEMAVIDGFARSANAVSLSDSDLMIVHSRDFMDLLYKYPDIPIALLREMAVRLRKSDSQIKSLSLGDATGRVGNTLLRLADDIGIMQAGRVELSSVPLQQDLANMAGTSRETISRVLHYFIQEKLIDRDGSKIIILDYNKFRDLFA